MIPATYDLRGFIMHSFLLLLLQVRKRSRRTSLVLLLLVHPLSSLSLSHHFYLATDIDNRICIHIDLCLELPAYIEGF